MCSEAKTPVFVSYKHGEDDYFKDKLLGHLPKELDAWDDSRILAGTNWKEAILHALKSADVVILLLSAEYLNSPHCLEEAAAARASPVVIPVSLRRYHPKLPPPPLRDWLETLNSPFPPHQPLNLAQDRDTALTKVVEAVMARVEEFRPQPTAVTENTRQKDESTPEIRDVAHQLKESLATHNKVALVGLAGSGKKMIAASCMQLYHDGVKLDARSDGALQTALESTAARRTIERPDRWAGLVQDLSGSRPSLIVFENALDPELIRPYLSQAADTNILITSHRRAWSVLDVPSRGVPVIDLATARRMLLERSGTPPSGEDELGAAEHIAEMLGRFPVALRFAAQYIGAGSLREYAQNFRDKLEEAVVENLPSEWGEHWANLSRQSAAGRHLMKMISITGLKRVPVDLVRERGHALTPELTKALSSEQGRRKILRSISEYCLADIESESAGNDQVEYIRVHPLVQAMIRRAMSISDDAIARRAEHLLPAAPEEIEPAAPEENEPLNVNIESERAVAVAHSHLRWYFKKIRESREAERHAEAAAAAAENGWPHSNDPFRRMIERELDRFAA